MLTAPSLWLPFLLRLAGVDGESWLSLLKKCRVKSSSNLASSGSSTTTPDAASSSRDVRDEETVRPYQEDKCVTELVEVNPSLHAMMTWLLHVADLFSFIIKQLFYLFCLH